MRKYIPVGLSGAAIEASIKCGEAPKRLELSDYRADLEDGSTISPAPSVRKIGDGYQTFHVGLLSSAASPHEKRI